MNSPEDLNSSDLMPVIVITGPTAVGKTKISVDLALRINADIVSADSRQIYKYMDIGTDKPTFVEKQGVKHHFLDYILPDEIFSAGEFGNKARDVIKKLRSEKRNVVVAGGSGLYIRALLYGMISFDQKDEKIRKELNLRLQKDGLAKLYNELTMVDPELAERLSENDTQRILRGLEVFRMSGERLSALQKAEEIPASFSYVQIGLNMDRSKLYTRINKRVENMFELGLIDEVKRLIKGGYAKSNAMNSVGYKEVIQYFNKKITYPEMVALIQRNTRRYAKRQLTWFRKDQSIHWFDLPDEGIVDKIIKLLNVTGNVI